MVYQTVNICMNSTTGCNKLDLILSYLILSAEWEVFVRHPDVALAHEQSASWPVDDMPASAGTVHAGDGAVGIPADISSWVQQGQAILQEDPSVQVGIYLVAGLWLSPITQASLP